MLIDSSVPARKVVGDVVRMGGMYEVHWCSAVLDGCAAWNPPAQHVSCSDAHVGTQAPGGVIVGATLSLAAIRHQEGSCRQQCLGGRLVPADHAWCITA